MVRSLKEDGFSEDNIKNAEDQVQNLTDKFINKVDELVKIKESDIMKV